MRTAHMTPAPSPAIDAGPLITDGRDQPSNPAVHRHGITCDAVFDRGRRLVSRYTCEASTLEQSQQQRCQAMSQVLERGDVVVSDEWLIVELADDLRFVVTVIIRPIQQRVR